MHSIPESTSPERNNPSTTQKSPSHSSTEIQSQQTNYENSDKISREDSAIGSEGNDECLGFKKSYSSQIQYKEDKDISTKNQFCSLQNDIPTYNLFKTEQMNCINNRKMSSPICNYYNEYHKYLSDISDKKLVDYSKSNNYIDKESLLQNKNNSSNHDSNNINKKTTPKTPNVTPAIIYSYIPDPFMPVFSFNNIQKASNVNYCKGLNVNENNKENDKKEGNTTLNKNPETVGSKTPSIPNTQPIIDNLFEFPFSIGTHTPIIHKQNNIMPNTQFIPFPIFIHKGMNTMTPVYGHPQTEMKMFPHFQLNTNNSCIERKKHKQFMERPGDWVCAKCRNLNFAFRLTCNKCHLQKGESEKIGEVKHSGNNTQQKSEDVNGDCEKNIQNEESSNTIRNDNLKVENKNFFFKNGDNKEGYCESS